MQKNWWFAGLALAALGIAGSLWVTGRFKAAPAPRVTDVVLSFGAHEVALASARVLPQIVSFSGPLVAPSTAIVRAKASGTLVNLTVAEGSRVKRGELLGQIDLAELKARLNERRALVESARAQFVQAQRAHASNEQLAKEQFISANALETSRAAMDTAQAQVNAAQAQSDAVSVGLREAGLIAPIAGIVAKRHALPGEKVAAEQAVLTLVDLRTLEMAGTVGTHEIAALRPGMPVQLTIEGDPAPVTGRLARIAPAVEAGSRAIGVTVSLDNPDERLRAGQFAMAQVSLAPSAPSLAVPLTALASASGQDFVWTIEQDKLVRRAVITGRRDTAGGYVEVLKGLSPNATVLAARFDRLQEGASARVQGAASPAPGSAPAAAPASVLAAPASAP